MKAQVCFTPHGKSWLEYD